MTTTGFRLDRAPSPSGETTRQREARLNAEASLLAVAQADIAAGRYIADSDLDGWLEAWETGQPVALPEAPAPSSKR
ncbi:hypothetical protein ACRBEV_17150 [Methylobacterium phyllosphaerae]